MNRIIWVLCKPLTLYDWNSLLEGAPARYYERGLDVRFLDISAMTPEEGSGEALDISEIMQPTDYITVSSWRDCRIFIDSLSREETIFLFQNAYGGFSIYNRMLHYLKSRGFRAALLLTWGSVMSYYKTRVKGNRYLGELIRNVTPINLWKFISRKVKKLPRELDFCILGGRRLLRSDFEAVNFSRTIEAHGHTYEQYLLEISNSDQKNPAGNSAEGPVVFIDQALTTHPDAAGRFRQYTRKYMVDLNRTLDNLESLTGRKVFVCPHPRGDIKGDGCWEKYGRLIWRGSTFDGIQSASLVVGHFSEAMGWAVLMNKPIITLSSNEAYFRDWNMKTTIFAGETGSPVFSLSDGDGKGRFHLNSVYNINETKYSEYIGSYISLLPNDKRQNVDIVAEALNIKLREDKFNG